MGMDWHSSGITTSVMGALKRGLAHCADELGLYVCGGRGRSSRNTPEELRAVSERRGFDGQSLIRTSRLTARIDNNAIADGFQIYLHSFSLSRDGQWAVVQQGLNEQTGMARRYHWHSASITDFVADPHAGIVGESQGVIMNLVDAKAKAAQSALLELTREPPPETLRVARYLQMPEHHDLRSNLVDSKRLGAVLATAHDRDLKSFADLLLVEKLGPRTLQSLALIAEVVHGAPSRFNDPARFSFALGGKDRHPFPVPLKTYDESLGFLRRALDSAKLGKSEKIDGFRRLDRFVRAVEANLAPEADFEAVVKRERRISARLRGRSVGSRPGAQNPKQGSLF